MMMTMMLLMLRLQFVEMCEARRGDGKCEEEGAWQDVAREAIEFDGASIQHSGGYPLDRVWGAGDRHLLRCDRRLQP